jgi:hypothetical protein
MPAKRGRGRHFVAAFPLALEAPILSVLAIGAAFTRALLADSRAAQFIARAVGELVVVSPGRRRPERARAGILLSHQR